MACPGAESWELVQHASVAEHGTRFDGSDIAACAAAVLNETEAVKKASMTFSICQAFGRGDVRIDVAAGSKVSIPEAPGRATDVQLVRPQKVKNSSRKHILHALVHAERNAIDLAWDVLLRFGYDRSSWLLPESLRSPELQMGSEGPAMAAASVADEKVTASVLADGTVAALAECDTGVSPSSEPPSAEEPPSSEAGAASAAAEGDLPTRLPDAFFQEWVRVAFEEAKHFTKWRLRLEELGSNYGAFPAHESLWESAADTADSALARLAIVHCVHEARGLDVADGLGARLGEADPASQAILQSNVGEEVSHVAAGRRWLEYLCGQQGLNPVLTFHALVRRYFRGDLRPPFHHDRRAAAGMTKEWYEPLAGAAPVGAPAGVAAGGSAASGVGGGGVGCAVEFSIEDMG